MLKFTWIYCSHCNAATVLCPRCGNNCCNASYGPKDFQNNTGRCPICDLAHQYERIYIQAYGSFPVEEHPGKNEIRTKWLEHFPEIF